MATAEDVTEALLYVMDAVRKAHPGRTDPVGAEGWHGGDYYVNGIMVSREQLENAAKDRDAFETMMRTCQDLWLAATKEVD